MSFDFKIKPFILNYYSYVPSSLQKLPYIFTLYLVKLISFPFYTQIYVRNSFLHSGFLPGISDLDFTCFYQINNYENQKNHIKILKILKKMIPLIGEFNFYDGNYLKFLQVANPIELKQDPFFKFYEKEFTHEEAIIFILKRLKYNLHNLNDEIITLRNLKWSNYYSLCEYPYPDINSKNEFINHLEKFIIYNKYNGHYLLYELLNKTNQFYYLLSYFSPAIWIKRYQTTTEIKYPLLFIKSIEWEIFGILGSYRILEYNSVKEHLLIIERFLSYKKELFLLEILKLLLNQVDLFFGYKEITNYNRI